MTQSGTATKGGGGPAKELEILTLLVVSYANCDPASAKKYTARIAEISGGQTGKDSSAGGKPEEEYGAELEKLAVPVFKKKEKKEGETTESSATAMTNKPTDQAQKKKKKRRNKLPKHIVPGKSIDPERWIPKQERSYYKGKRKGKTTGNRGAQGAVSASVAGGGEGVASAEFEEEEKPKLSRAEQAKQAAEEKAAEVAAKLKEARGGKVSAPRGRGGRGGRRKK